MIDFHSDRVVENRLAALEKKVEELERDKLFLESQLSSIKPRCWNDARRDFQEVADRFAHIAGILDD